MAGFKAAFYNEIDKLLKKKKIISAALLSIIAVVIGQIAVTVINRGLGLRVVGSSEFSIMVLSALLYTLLPLFSIFVAIDMFSGEFSANTIKLTLTRPVSRFAVYCAKVLSVAVFILANLFFVMILSIIIGLIFNISSGSFMGVVRIIISYIITFLPIFIFSLFVILLTNIFKNGLTVFLCSILIFIILKILEVFFGSYSSFFVTSMFDWYRLWISESLSIFKIIRQFFIMLGCGIMFFTGGYYLFDKKDF